MQTPELTAALRADAEVTVKISGDRELRRLNRQFLGYDETTDVLSFPSVSRRGAEAYLGDIVVSWSAVQRQAPEHGHDSRAELKLLLVHGLLHLLGWDHATPEQQAQMTQMTDAVLARVT
jgi:probable rRNA maturation factor